MFFNLYGKCKKQNKGCPYHHDLTKVVVCRHFLAGKCTNEKCLLRHTYDVEENSMPTCQNFLQGICLDENCKFSHVRVNSNAAICPKFEKGYCELGAKCKLKHIRLGKPQKQKRKTRTKGEKSSPLAHNDSSPSDSSDSHTEEEEENKRHKKRKKMSKKDGNKKNSKYKPKKKKKEKSRKGEKEKHKDAAVVLPSFLSLSDSP